MSKANAIALPPAPASRTTRQKKPPLWALREAVELYVEQEASNGRQGKKRLNALVEELEQLTDSVEEEELEEALDDMRAEATIHWCTKGNCECGACDGEE